MKRLSVLLMSLIVIFAVGCEDRNNAPIQQSQGIPQITVNDDYKIKALQDIIQKEPENVGSLAEIIMLTHKVKEMNMVAAIEQIEALESIADKVMKIRVESLL